jgi:hypothetical protein
MLTNNMLILLVPGLFILDLILTIGVRIKRVSDVNFIALIRFITLVLGSISTWLLFFDVPSHGVLLDYLIGIVLLYFIPIRLIFVR